MPGRIGMVAEPIQAAFERRASSRLQSGAAIDPRLRAGHVSCSVGAEPQHRRRAVLGLGDPPERIGPTSAIFVAASCTEATTSASLPHRHR